MFKWESFKIGDKKYLQLIMGQSPPSKYYNNNTDGLPFFQGKKEFGELYPEPVVWCSQPNKIAEKGDILLSVRAPVGPTNLAKEKCCIGRGLAALRANDEKLLTKYILYFFKNLELELESQGQGSTFKAISAKTLREMTVICPPLPEQRRIVQKLDGLFAEIDAGIALIDENIAKAEALKLSVLDAEFNKIKNRKDSLSFNIGEKDYLKLIMGQSPPSKYYNKNKEGLPFFQGKKQFGELFPKIDTWCSNPKKVADSGDILLSVRAPVGPTNLANAKCCIGRGLAALRPNKEILITKFILYHLKNFELEISAKGQGSTFNSISGKKLKQIKIVYPKKEEQQKIVKRLDQAFAEIDGLIVHYTQKRLNLEALKSSLLDRAFKGEL